MKHKTGAMSTLLVVVGMCAVGAQAQVTIETVTVGNPGNTGELSGGEESQPPRICGAVDYVYRIGQFEITAGQYAAFLNAVAATDTYALYNTSMAAGEGCRIRQIAGPSGYTYIVDANGDGLEDAGWVNRPVNYVSWGDAARFANWLHNDQPEGAQDLTTTEDGSYYLNGATTNEELVAVTLVRKSDATWVIPSEDEWYKAAHHKNDGMTGNYYDYPTSNDNIPSNDLVDPDPGNNANFYQSGYTIGGPYWRTEVGDFANSESPYGTFDQGGNVWEWNEDIVPWPGDVLFRGVRGGAFNYDSRHGNLRAVYRSGDYPTDELSNIGFRVADVFAECGNGVVEYGEVCDDGNESDNDFCLSTCQINPSIPAVSEWGVVAMTLLVLTAGTVVFLRRRAAA